MKIASLVWIQAAALGLIVGAVPVVASAQEPNQHQELPDSPSAVIAQRTVEAQPFQGQALAAATPPQPSQPQSQPSPQASQLQSSSTQKPVGTAAAETTSTTGVAASNPAGAAIAPAKQKRTRVFLIKVGALVGAGVAVGTVAALASASPSKPPGSR